MQSLLEQAEGLQQQVASVLLKRIRDKETNPTHFAGSPEDSHQSIRNAKGNVNSSNYTGNHTKWRNDGAECSDSMVSTYEQSEEAPTRPYPVNYSGCGVDSAALLSNTDASYERHNVDRGDSATDKELETDKERAVDVGRGRLVKTISDRRFDSGPDQQFDFQRAAHLGGGIAPDSALTQLDWLIKGLPEAYDDEDTDMSGRPLDDLAVEKLIREGGLPPSQLVFPSLHAVGQQIMKKLQGAKCLVVTFNHVFVYSARYGVRRHSSRLSIRAPEGCRSSGNEPESVILDLPELLGRSIHREEEAVDQKEKSRIPSRGLVRSPSAVRPKKRASVGVGPDAFFVGGADLQRTVQFPIEGLSDRVLKGWLQGGGGGCLRIELESHVAPPYKGVSVQPNVRYILTEW